nr:hypothetical protein [Tanacetum cinerariifolium]
MATDYGIMKEEMSKLSGRKSVPGMNSYEKGKMERKDYSVFTKKSIAKKLKTNEDIQKQKETPSPSKETTTESTPTRRTKATAARGLHLQNTPPSENPPTTPQTETMNVQNTRILSPVIQNDSTQTPTAKAVKIKDKIRKNYETKVAGEKKEKEQVNKKKKDGKAKKEEQVKKKMVKLKGKKKVEDDDEDFVIEEQHDEEDDN